MKKTLLLACLAVLVCVTSFAAPAAEQPKAAAAADAAPAMTAQEKAAFAKQVDLFAQVASYGEKEKDPLVLLTAVKMLDDLPFGGIGKADAKDKGAYDRAGLLALAKQNATGDAELLAVIAKLEEAPEATAVRGRRDGDRDRDDRPGRYYERRRHERRFECNWYRECGRHGCEWVCGRRHRGYRD
jgi:hypothetical protein